MNIKNIKVNYVKTLITLYIISSAASMSVFLFTSTPSLDEYTAINAVALWGVLLDAVLLLALLVLVAVSKLTR